MTTVLYNLSCSMHLLPAHGIIVHAEEHAHTHTHTHTHTRTHTQLEMVLYSLISPAVMCCSPGCERGHSLPAALVRQHCVAFHELLLQDPLQFWSQYGTTTYVKTHCIQVCTLLVCQCSFNSNVVLWRCRCTNCRTHSFCIMDVTQV